MCSVVIRVIITLATRCTHSSLTLWRRPCTTTQSAGMAEYGSAHRRCRTQDAKIRPQYFPHFWPCHAGCVFTFRSAFCICRSFLDRLKLRTIFGATAISGINCIWMMRITIVVTFVCYDIWNVLSLVSLRNICFWSRWIPMRRCHSADSNRWCTDADRLSGQTNDIY